MNLLFKWVRKSEFSCRGALMTLLWAILNPGNDGLEELGVDDGTSLTGVVATALLVMYQLMSVIILLNLLIAVMNATIQKTQQRYLLFQN